jgi:hypothetical protein
MRMLGQGSASKGIVPPDSETSSWHIDTVEDKKNLSKIHHSVYEDPFLFFFSFQGYNSELGVVCVGLGMLIMIAGQKKG